MGWNDHCNMIEIVMDEEEANGLTYPESYEVALATVQDLIRDGEHSCAQECR